MKDQINVFTARGISAGVLKISENVDTQYVTLFNDSVTFNTETDCQILDKILNGEYKILFGHHEAILSKEGRRLMKSNEYQKRMAVVSVVTERFRHRKDDKQFQNHVDNTLLA